jgi:hypothetical protein
MHGSKRFSLLDQTPHPSPEPADPLSMGEGNSVFGILLII